MYLCMATKTISVSEEAYERLTAARTTERESFSRVICRAEWPAKAGTAGDLLKLVRSYTSEADIDFLDEVQKEDLVLRDPWDDE